MIFNKHSHLEGAHAFLGASNYSWLNYSPEKIAIVWKNSEAKKRGTELHDYAARSIRLCQKLKGKSTIAQYVNDGIDFGMSPEQILFYSRNCFGTVDAISFDGKMLRIHDLKTGEVPAKMDQLMIYAALFCLEYMVPPESIKIELRIYQSNSIRDFLPDPIDIRSIMNRIISNDRIIEDIRSQEE